MSMGFGMSLTQNMQQRLRLSLTQKLALKQLMALRQELKHPEFPDAVIGLEGMLVAHETLKKKDAAGILIGGLSESIWNRQRTQADLLKHKDVDVLVLDYGFQVENFEGGVDWWLPRDGSISIKKNYVTTDNLILRWYENGNGIVLSFGLEGNHLIEKPGLYLPSQEFVISMRMAEAQARIDYERVDVEFSDDVWDKFRTSIERRVKTRLPRFIADKFKGYIMSEQYEKDSNISNAVSIDYRDMDTLRAIEVFRKNHLDSS